MAKTYKIRGHGDKYFGIPANAIGAELEKIRRKDGHIEAEAVVDAARPEKSPLHIAFTWDDREASEEWRKHEARQLIRLVVVHEDGKPESRAYFNIRVQNDKGKTKQHYQAGEVIVGRPAEFESAYSILMNHVRGAARAIEDLKRLAQGEPESDRLALLVAVHDALSTARTVAERLQ